MFAGDSRAERTGSIVVLAEGLQQALPQVGRHLVEVAIGELSATPVVNSEPGTVAFDRHDELIVSEAGTNAVATFDLHHDGTVTPRQAVTTGQAATCWIVGVGGQCYASKGGSASVSRFDSGHHGTLTFLDNTAASENGDFLYVQAGANGVVDEYSVNADGSLTQIGSLTVANAIGGEGIVAI